MVKITILLLMTLTISCQTKYKQKLICAQISRHQIPPVAKCDISFRFNRCRCRCFDLNNWNTLSLNQCSQFRDLEGTSHNFPLEYCDGVDGFFLSEEASTIRPNVKALANVRDNLCQ